MPSTTVVLVIAQLLAIQSTTAQYIGYGAPSAYAGPAAALSASNGPGLLITSSSPAAPVGISIFSENVIDGALSVVGTLPFLSTVAVEAVLPTAGSGNVAYNCGNGAVGITVEDVDAPLGYAVGPLGYGPGPLGYGAGLLGYNAGPLAYGAGPFGYAGSLGYGAGSLGYGAGPLSYAGTLGYGAGPYSYGAGLGYGPYCVGYGYGPLGGYGDYGAFL